MAARLVPILLKTMSKSPDPTTLSRTHDSRQAEHIPTRDLPDFLLRKSSLDICNARIFASNVGETRCDCAETIAEPKENRQ
jgi:hypothetical protein